MLHKTELSDCRQEFILSHKDESNLILFAKKTKKIDDLEKLITQ